MKNKLWILSLGTVILAIVTAVILIMVQGGRVESGTVLRSIPAPGDGQTAKSAYGVLQQWTNTWHEDARLVSASTTVIKNDPGSGGWTFLVYSAKHGQVAVASVQNKNVVVLREQTSLYPQKPLDLQRWQVDSDQFLNRWWEQGGHATWTTSEAHSLHIRLGMQDPGVPTWQLSVLDVDGNLVDLWNLDASNEGEASP